MLSEERAHPRPTYVVAPPDDRMFGAADPSTAAGTRAVGNVASPAAKKVYPVLDASFRDIPPSATHHGAALDLEASPLRGGNGGVGLPPRVYSIDLIVDLLDCTVEKLDFPGEDLYAQLEPNEVVAGDRSDAGDHLVCPLSVLDRDGEGLEGWGTGWAAKTARATAGKARILDSLSFKQRVLRILNLAAWEREDLMTFYKSHLIRPLANYFPERIPATVALAQASQVTALKERGDAGWFLKSNSQMA